MPLFFFTPKRHRDARRDDSVPFYPTLFSVLTFVVVIDLKSNCTSFHCLEASLIYDVSSGGGLFVHIL